MEKHLRSSLPPFLSAVARRSPDRFFAPKPKTRINRSTVPTRSVPSTTCIVPAMKRRALPEMRNGAQKEVPRASITNRRTIREEQ